MRKLFFSGLLSVCLAGAASSAAAAEIHGTITENGKPVPKGVAVKLACGEGTAAASATTDEFGAYSVKTAAAGDCTLSLDYKGAAPLKVVVYEKPSRYDFEVKTDAGKVTLARK